MSEDRYVIVYLDGRQSRPLDKETADWWCRLPRRRIAYRIRCREKPSRRRMDEAVDRYLREPVSQQTRAVPWPQN
jgi:hypothetical protein